MVHWSNTSHVHYAKTRPGKPTVLATPVHADFRVAKREGVMHVAAEFVNTAVRRHDVAVSYDITTPNLHSGYTRKAWATQDIPVQPYPLDSARYKLMGSFTDQVWLQVAVYPDQRHKSVPAAVFDLTLKPSRTAARAPLARRRLDAGELHRDPERAARQRRPAGSASNVEYKSGLSNAWLLVPISGFIIGFFLLIGIGARGWWRNNRAVKSYRRTLALIAR